MSQMRTRNPSPLAGEGNRSAPLNQQPSPLVGEGGEDRRSEPGEGALSPQVTRARKLRAEMTDAERTLWRALRDRRFAGYKFRRQAPIGPYVADFLCYDCRIVVEADGGQHAGSQRDKRRDAWFAANGYRVVRFWNNDILSNLEGVLTVLHEALQEGTPHPARAAHGHPSPARGEGNRSVPRNQQPSPLAGEGGEDRRSEPGEGAFPEVAR